MKTDLLDAPTDTALVPVDPFLSMVERLATNKDVDVEKLARLIQMQEGIIAHNAKAAFNTAFAEMQGEIPAIVERAKTNNGTYAPLEDIQEVVRPILQKHGFSLSFRTEWPDKTTVKVVGILTHRDGHQRESEFMSGADASGNKNNIQGLGSAVTYGRRYTTKDLLNITTRGVDDDGRNAGKIGKPDAPTGYDDWLTDIEAVADEGEARLREAWNRSKPVFRNHISKNDPGKWVAMKAKAAAVKS